MPNGLNFTGYLKKTSRGWCLSCEKSQRRGEAGGQLPSSIIAPLTHRKQTVDRGDQKFNIELMMWWRIQEFWQGHCQTLSGSMSGACANLLPTYYRNCVKRKRYWNWYIPGILTGMYYSSPAKMCESHPFTLS